MADSIHIESETGAAIVSCYGVVGFAHAVQYLEELWEHPDWAGRAVLWDFREAELDVESSDARKAAGFTLRHQPDPPPARVARVTGRDVDFGMARVYQVFRQHPATEFKVFKDYGEGLAWVRELGHRSDPEGPA